MVDTLHSLSQLNSGHSQKIYTIPPPIDQERSGQSFHPGLQSQRCGKVEARIQTSLAPCLSVLSPSVHLKGDMVVTPGGKSNHYRIPLHPLLLIEGTDAAHDAHRTVLRHLPAGGRVEGSLYPNIGILR